MIESFSLIASQGDEIKIVALLININIHYPNTNVYILCADNLKSIVESIPFNFTIKITYIETLIELFLKAKEDIKNKINYFKLHFTLMKEALKHHKNTMFLDRYNIILNKFDINFEECKDKIAGIKMLDSDTLLHSLYFIDSVETIEKWDTIIYDTAIEQYKIITAQKCDVSGVDASGTDTDASGTNTSQNCDISGVDVSGQDILENIDENEVFINIYSQLLVKKNDILEKHTELLYYLPKHNSITSWDFFRRENNISVSQISFNEDTLLFNNEKISSIILSPEMNDANVHKMNSKITTKLYEIAKKYYRLLNLQNNKKILFNIPPTNSIIPFFQDKEYGLYNLIRIWNKKFTEIVMFKHISENNYFELGDLILYNYPNNQYFLNNMLNKKVLCGTLDVKTDLTRLDEHKIHYSPWIYWPKHADKVEELLDNSSNIIEKTVNTVFIGSLKHEERKDFIPFIENIKLWDSSNTMLDYEEYLQEIAKAKYGICSKETTCKSHRLMEYLAFGTVPIIINNEINTDSFLVPLEENKHFLSVNSIEDIENTIVSTTDETWKILSENGKSWYMENIHSNQSFKNLITYFFMN